MRTKIVFPQGIPGFEDVRTCQVERVEEGPFYVLEEEAGDLSLVLVEPEAFFHQYHFEASANELNLIELTSEEDAQVLVIATLAERPEEICVNLKAPIIINKRNASACQIIDTQGRYETRVPLFTGE
ncbi:flagellar assembly factor FliW [Tumebacillus sp. BK434]|uniref:flagellar assembly protein FliW n=1 Tax=Tumebacillus sp. BK434 TaxID=2512169 RepID=UPI0010E6CC12|nr:flagellar assembly protein FliW [Tumebacillus sp. BK434]TCP57838.1 flagellar assembly factor FliW [Tumebacillus sp. BK434]